MSDLSDQDIGVREGDILAGKYRVDRILGVGGMGVVVAAHHVQLDDHVAIKFLLPEMLNNAECVLRFAREARAAVKIKSEHVARVTDVGKLESGSPYMVMEFLEGEDLSAWISRGPLRIEQAVDFVLQACEAIAEAHSLGIVHRDLKPANLFCIKRPGGQASIKVLDFGISKVTGGAQDVSMTRTTAVIGSPVYMSPEQMKSSREVDNRTDIWALGVILFELLTGRTPFGGDTVTEVAIHIAMDPTPPPRSLRPEIPLGLDAAICKCLEKDRAKRFQNVGEFASALVEFGSKRARRSFEEIEGTLRSSGIQLEGVLHPSGGVDALAPATGSVSMPDGKHGSTIGAWQADSGTKRTGKTIIGVIAATVVLGASVAAFLAMRRAPPPAQPSQAAVTVAPTAAAPPPPAPAETAPPAATPPPAATAAPTAPSETPSATAAATAAPEPKPGHSHSSHSAASTPAGATHSAPPAATTAPAAPPASAKYNPLDHL
ncbi:MAG: serine/threonine protein kinase [Polyangiaceae bacterium]